MDSRGRVFLGRELGMRTALAALILMIAFTASVHAQEVREIRCFAVDADDDRPIDLGRYSVLRESRRDGPLSVNFTGEINVVGISCRRTSPVPQPNDYKVAMAGLALFLVTRRDGSIVQTVLFIQDGQFVLQILEGRLTAAERAQTIERIESYYEVVNAQSNVDPQNNG